MEEDYEPSVQSQRRVNPKIHDVIKKEVEKLLDAGLIYPISDSPWVSPVHCVPKKGGMTVITNEENELIPTRLVTGWRVCIDYRKLNEATRKDHFPLPFMDQMLERLAGNEYYCFLDGFSGYFQIPIDPKDQEKTTFTCPYGTFAYRRMPFGLCNAPGTFQRCMMAIFHDMIEKTMEVFMDDFSVFGDSFSTCLTHLEKMLKRCEDTNLSLNWEKSHFMVKEGIVLGHKISSRGLENLTLNIRDNKGAEESRAVICPVLDNPLNDKLEENKEINEAFPLETLGSIALQDQSDRRCVSGQEALEFSSLAQLDLLGDTYGANYKQKNFRLGFYWGPNHLQGPPDFVTVVHLSTSRKNTARDEMPQKLHSCEKSLTSGAFDFMGQFRLQRNKAYENFLILIKRKTRGIHDAKIKKPRVNVGDRVILFNYRTEDFLGQIEITYSRIVKALDSVIFNSSFTSSASFWEFRKRYLTKDRKTQLQKMTKPDTEWKSCEGQSQSKAK
ncbi:reverse transcriptase domain-containing protein [Tanacetum coccineum]